MYIRLLAQGVVQIPAGQKSATLTPLPRMGQEVAWIAIYPITPTTAPDSYTVLTALGKSTESDEWIPRLEIDTDLAYDVDIEYAILAADLAP